MLVRLTLTMLHTNKNIKQVHMKNSVTVVITGLLLFILIPTSRAQNISLQQKAIIEKQVDSIFTSMVKIAETLNLDKLSTGVDDAHRAGFISGGEYFNSYDSLLLVVKSNSGNLKSQKINIQKQKVTVLSENIVLLSAAGEATAERSNGNTFSVSFFWSFVYEKINGVWKVIQSHQSTTR